MEKLFIEAIEHASEALQIRRTQFNDRRRAHRYVWFRRCKKRLTEKYQRQTKNIERTSF